MWERIAARTGGTVAGLAEAVGERGEHMLFAATPTGIFRSDAGGPWAPTSTGATVPFATAVAASPRFAEDGLLFAAARDGVYRSRDRGRTWARVLIGGPIFAVAISPTVADDGTLFVATAEDGVLRSDDGGTSWSGANAGLLDLTVLALALSPRFAEDRTAFAGTASGLYRSRNGGRSWREVETGLDGAGVQALAISPDFPDDRLVLAGTEEDGLLRSDDGGTTWEPVDALDGRGVTAIALAAHADTSSRGGSLLAVATEDVVFVTDDAGDTWRATNALASPALALAYTFAKDEAALGAALGLTVGLAERGVARLAADGTSWAEANDGLHATPLAMLVPSPNLARDGTLFAASSDGGLLVSRDTGSTLEPWTVVLDEPMLTGLAVSPRFADDRTAWVAAADGLYRTFDAGRTWDRLPFPNADGPTVAPRSLAVTLSDVGQPVLFAATSADEVARSDDGGTTWRSLGRVAPSLELVSVAASPTFRTDRALFATTTGANGPSSEGGLVLWRSADAGVHWDRWLDAAGAGLLPLAIPSSHWRDGSVLVGVGRHVMTPIPNTRERRGGVSRPLWRPTDLGYEVAAIVALATPPGNEAGRTVFAATNAGVYLSRDGGQSFARWSEGLAPTSVVALAVSPAYDADHTVFAIGLGGTIWRHMM